MNKRILKRICCFVACFLFVFCLAGCGGGEDPPPQEKPGQEEEESVKEERDIEASDPADGGSASLANAKIAAFAESFDICESEKYTDGTDLYAPAGLTLSWTCKQSAQGYTVSLSQSEDMSDAAVYETEQAQLHVDDLFAATDYYWQVEAKTQSGTLRSDVFRFTTKEEPRTVLIEGVSNTRDIGGYAAADGKRLRQGMIYRGGKLEDITQAGREKMLETYKIRTDLDLRRGEESTNVFGDEMQYIQISAPYYTTPNGTTGIDVAGNREAIANIMKVFAEEENYPVYMHCSIGRDRTGTFAMLLEMLLGVGEYDIYLDYELSLFSAAGCSDNTPVNTLFYTYFWPTYSYIDQNYEGDTMSEKCEAFLLDVGVTAEEIASIRSLLLV